MARRAENEGTLAENESPPLLRVVQRCLQKQAVMSSFCDLVPQPKCER